MQVVQNQDTTGIEFPNLEGGDTVEVPVALPLKKTDCPSPNSYHLPIAPLLRMELHAMSLLLQGRNFPGPILWREVLLWIPTTELCPGNTISL